MARRRGNHSALLRRRVLLPAYWKFVKRSRVLEDLRQLEDQQWNPVEENRLIQARKLYRLLAHASRHIAYYKRIVQERGIRISEDRIFDALREFPPLTKGLIREHFDELSPLGGIACHLNHSGGSTGEPVQFYQDVSYESRKHAVKLLFREWAGCAVGARVVKLWGSERDVFYGSQGLRGKLSSMLHNSKLVNGFNLSESDMAEFVRLLSKLRPTTIVAYVDAIHEVARYILDRRVDPYSPLSVVASAGTLFPSFREKIESAFRAPVFNRYGARETGDVACECEEHAGLHTLPTTHVLEVVDPKGAGCLANEVGEILVTPLENFSMPLIRYAIGDRGAISDRDCPCGRGLPMLAGIEGRSTSRLRNRRGDYVSPLYFIHLIGVVLDDGHIIQRFQVVQEEEDLVVVKLVVASTTPSALRQLLESIKEKTRLVMGDETRVECELVSEIPPSPSGKYLYVTSKVEA